jgi:ribosomal protein S18 acetylase RimI-like enzyme
VTNPHALDQPTRSALEGPHSAFAERKGRVLRYPPDVCPFYGMPDDPDERDWADLAELAGPGGLVGLSATWLPFPAHWEAAFSAEGVQLVAGEQPGHDVVADDEIIRLGRGDVPQMLDLVQRTKPGPFRTRTIELGTYLGIRRDGRLVAMAGERIHPPGYCEISAVCTDEEWRGRGFGSRLTLAVAAAIRARGETPFLHAVATNATAIRLYEQLGFKLRQPTMFKTAYVPS